MGYRRGPLGWAVAVDGKPVGRIGDHRRTAAGGWTLSIAGMTSSGLGTDSLHHRTLQAAKAAVRRHFTDASTTRARETEAT